MMIVFDMIFSLCIFTTFLTWVKPFTFIISLNRKTILSYYYPHFTNEETRQRSWSPCPRSHYQWMSQVQVSMVLKFMSLNSFFILIVINNSRFVTICNIFICFLTVIAPKFFRHILCCHHLASCKTFRLFLSHFQPQPSFAFSWNWAEIFVNWVYIT